MNNSKISETVQSQIGEISSPIAGTYKVVGSEGEKMILHAPKVTRFVGKIKDFNQQQFCVVCGREAQYGNFCSMSCQGEQYGV